MAQSPKSTGQLGSAGQISSGRPVLFYFGIRGRAEPIRLLFAANDAQYDFRPTTYDDFKGDLEGYPFGQLPRLQDGHLNIVQTKVILRYLADKSHFIPKRLADKLTSEMVVEGVDDLYNVYTKLIYEGKLSEEAKEAYWKKHCDKASITESFIGGAHLEFLARILRKNVTGSGFVVGPEMSLADIVVFNITDVHSRIFPDLRTAYPELYAHWLKMTQNQKLKAYLTSPMRFEKVNGNGLG